MRHVSRRSALATSAVIAVALTGTLAAAGGSAADLGSMLAAPLAAAPPAARPDSRTGWQPVGSAAASGKPVAVHIVSRAGAPAAPPDPAEPADDQPRRARADQGATLYAVVEVADGKRHRFYSDAGTILLDGVRRDTAPLADGPALSLRWSRVEPTTNDMSNTASGSFRFEPIAYAETDLPVAAGQRPGAIAADVRPTLTPNHGGAAPGLGTMRYRLHARTAGGAELASPGAEARRGRGSGGLTDAVLRVSHRRDDTYLGYLTEMYGQPYIWASAGTTDRAHQSEHLEGSDCADFVIYGQRRLGASVSYTWTGGLSSYTRSLGRGTLGDDGIYRDKRGEPLKFPAPGDLILFPRHVGALVADRGRTGILDSADIMMHTLFDSPKEEAIATSGYAETPVELLRWKR